jgi:hypothetical protein
MALAVIETQRVTAITLAARHRQARGRIQAAT